MDELGISPEPARKALEIIIGSSGGGDAPQKIEAPVRQFVLTFPFPLRLLLAGNALQAYISRVTSARISK